jgi:hypothetical protein
MQYQHQSKPQHIDSQINESNVLDELQDYMLTNSFIKKYCKNNFNHNKIKSSIDKQKNNLVLKSNNIILNESIAPITKINNEHFTPQEKDKLFWCFYIFLNGYEKYELEKSSSFTIEKEFKFMIAEKLKHLKKQVKELGFKINDIQEELTSQSNITEKSLLILCYLYKINIIYVKNNYYFEMKYSELEETPYHFIIQENNKTYIINTNNSNNSDYSDKLSFYTNNYWKIENINKPIKSFSNYTLIELQDICKRLKLPIEKNNKKMLKKELYESIIKVF